VELAMATRTAPADWWDESDEVLATALDVLDRQAQQVKTAKGGRRGKRG
jgi:hypothetical protein